MWGLLRGPLSGGYQPETHPGAPNPIQLREGHPPPSEPDLLMSEGGEWQGGCSLMKSSAQALAFCAVIQVCWTSAPSPAAPLSLTLDG